MAKKTYKVTGAHEQFGVKPGDTFEMDIAAEFGDPDMERRLLEKGAIKEASDGTATTTKPEGITGKPGEEPKAQITPSGEKRS